jgi:N-methylhydantoinase B
MTDRRVDPVTTAVIGNRIDAITKEIGEAMLRTSRSPVFSEARDFVTSIFSSDGSLVAQTHYIPVIGGSTPFSQKAIIDAFGEDIHEGDVFVINDPYHGNNHPPDVAVTRPVFWEGKLRYWVSAKGHHADVGGGGVVGYNPAAKDVWEEALRIPPLRLVDAGKRREDVFRLILTNVRIPFLVEGDLECQMGATSIGERGIKDLLRKYGADVLESSIEQLLNASEAQVRREIEAIPDGVYRAERKIDNDGIDKDRMPSIQVCIKVKGNAISFDFSESDKQVRGYMNSPFPNTVSSAHLAFFACINPDIRYNSGAFRPIEVVAPTGSIANPLPPAPCTGCTVPTCETMVEACWLALAQAIPLAAHSLWARWCSPATMGLNPKTGRFFADIHFIAKGGGGATAGFNGWDHIGTLVCLGGLRSPDPELHELVSPYLLLNYEYLPDSSGPGEWRGGAGVHYRWKVLANDISCVNFGSGQRIETAPVGISGGGGAPPHKLVLTRANGTVENVDSNAFYMLMEGDIFDVKASGGGGFGDPRRRSVTSVMDDVRDGFVSPHRAKEDYGVIVDPNTLLLDERATDQARAN